MTIIEQIDGLQKSILTNLGELHSIGLKLAGKSGKKKKQEIIVNRTVIIQTCLLDLVGLAKSSLDIEES